MPRQSFTFKAIKFTSGTPCSGLGISVAGCLLVGFLQFLLAGLYAAPYPPDGLATTWTQPSGTVLDLRVRGDEFYGRTTTAEGYTVIFEPTDQTYYYAETAPDGVSLIPSNVPADQSPP